MLNMNTNPYTLGEWSATHRQQLLREAEVEQFYRSTTANSARNMVGRFGSQVLEMYNRASQMIQSNLELRASL